MSETEYHSPPVAKLGIPKRPDHVPANIITLRTIISKLRSSDDHIVAEADLLVQETHVGELFTCQQGMSGSANDRTPLRNHAYTVCFLEHLSNMMKLQLAANANHNFMEAAALIKRNGFEVKKERSSVARNPIWIKRKKNSENVIIAKVKAPKTRKRYAIEWQYSYDDGQTWNSVYPTGVCEREIGDLETLHRVKVMARIIIGNDPPLDWMVSNSINI